jgi:hypothetical protein
LKVEGSTVPSRRQPLEAVIKASHVAFQSELDQLAREDLGFVLDQLLN